MKDGLRWTQVQFRWILYGIFDGAVVIVTADGLIKFLRESAYIEYNLGPIFSRSSFCLETRDAVEK